MLLFKRAIKSLLAYFPMSSIARDSSLSSSSHPGGASDIGTAVIVPLYIYPNPGAWDSLYSAIKANPSQNFNIIVNPNSGPGADKYPDANYIVGIQRLKTFPSVRTVGYVHASYGSRNIADVVKDIDTYAGWAAYSKTNPITVDGIFIDEAPSDYGPRNKNLNYIKTLSTKIQKTFDNIRNKKSGGAFIIMNPGVVAGNKYYGHVSSVVAFEESIAGFNASGTLFHNSDKTKSTGVPRSKEAVIIHSYWESLRRMKELVHNLVEVNRIGNIFLTSRDPNKGQDPYDAFGSFFGEFVKAVEDANASLRAKCLHRP